MLNIIKYDNANALEATWLRELTPEVITPEVLDEEGNVTETSKVTAATYEQIASIAYADTQMDLLRADVVKYGGDLTEYEDLIAEVESNIQPYVAPVKTQTEINQEALTYLGLTDWYVVRFAETGVAIPTDVTILRQEARANII